MQSVEGRQGSAEVAYARGLTAEPPPDDLPTAIRAAMFEPDCPTYS